MTERRTKSCHSLVSFAKLIAQLSTYLSKQFEGVGWHGVVLIDEFEDRLSLCFGLSFLCFSFFCFSFLCFSFLCFSFLCFLFLCFSFLFSFFGGFGFWTTSPADPYFPNFSRWCLRTSMCSQGITSSTSPAGLYFLDFSRWCLRTSMCSQGITGSTRIYWFALGCIHRWTTLRCMLVSV